MTQDTRGGRVQLLEGTFFLGDSILLSDNITLAGLSASTILKLEDNHGYNGLFLVRNNNINDGNEGITIQDITFDGNKNNQTMGYQHGVGFSKVSEARITGCVFREFSGAGIFANRLRNSIISGNAFEKNNYGINIEGFASEGNLFLRLVRKVLRFVRSASGIKIEGLMSRDNSLTNNSFLRNVTTDILIADSVRNIIMNNTHEGDTSTSWRLSGAICTTIYGNISKKQAGYGLYMDGKSYNNTIFANSSEGGIIGFSVTDSDYNSFQENIAIKATNYGFGFEKVSSHNLVVVNTAEENGNEGIMFHTNCVYNVVLSNRCERNGHHGISFLYGCDYNTATGNNLLENGQANVGQCEIYIHKSSYNLISANNCKKITGRDYDIYITDKDSVGNIIVNNVGKLFNGGEKTRY